jgi:H+/Na+-translocating ferredoxin:NAD+ oxidoreductase subunit A
VGELALILVATALVNNVVLLRALGVCPLFGASMRLESAVAIALATGFVLTLTAMLAYAADRLLLQPLGATHLRILSFIVLIAATVQVTELIVRHRQPLLYEVLGLQLPLVAANCAVLGVTLLTVTQARTFVEAALEGIGTAAGFALALVLFTGLRERIVASDVPAPFRGPAILLVTAALMSLAFLGFAGLAGT